VSFGISKDKMTVGLLSRMNALQQNRRFWIPALHFVSTGMTGVCGHFRGGKFAPVALPSPCSASRSSRCAVAPRTLTPPRGDGRWHPCRFGVRRGLRAAIVTKATWLQIAAPMGRSHPEGAEAHVWTAPATQGKFSDGGVDGSCAVMCAACECGVSRSRWP
jgi:hypothetical protein